MIKHALDLLCQQRVIEFFNVFKTQPPPPLLVFTQPFPLHPMHFFILPVVPPPKFPNESFQFLYQAFREFEVTHSIGRNSLNNYFD